MKHVIIRPSHEEICLYTASFFTALAKTTPRFIVALCGGSTPRLLYEILATGRFASTIPWHNCFFFWGDERCVPPEDERSNYRMAKEALLNKIPVPADQVFRIPAEEVNEPDLSYEKRIRSVFHNLKPRFHFLLLGLGEDAHTASLFPGSTALKAKDRLVVAVPAPSMEPRVPRITFTPHLINEASCIVFLVAGESKAAAVQHVLEGPYDPEKFPAQAIEPTSGNLLFVLDAKAAQRLSP